MTKNILVSSSAAILLVASFTLTGCGGGGGSTTTTSTTPTTPVAPPSNPVQAASLQSAVTPTYSTTSEEYGFYQALNAFRTSQGLGPLNQDPAYDKAAAAHANYVNINGTSHGEVPGLSGYTGGNPMARVMSQGGNANYVGEDIGIPTTIGAKGSGASVLSAFVDSVYHRAQLMYQPLTSFGVAIGMGGSQTASVVDVGYFNPQKNAGDYLGVYPYDGQTGVGTYTHPESPNPFPSNIDPVTQTGYPISVASENSTTLKVTSFTIAQTGSSTPLGTMMFTSATDTNLTGANNLVFIVPTQNLLPNTSYTVNFVGTITGTATGSSTGIAKNLTWKFTTGSGS